MQRAPLCCRVFLRCCSTCRGLDSTKGPWGHDQARKRTGWGIRFIGVWVEHRDNLQFYPLFLCIFIFVPLCVYIYRYYSSYLMKQPEERSQLSVRFKFSRPGQGPSGPRWDIWDLWCNTCLAICSWSSRPGKRFLTDSGPYLPVFGRFEWLEGWSLMVFWWGCLGTRWMIQWDIMG